METDGIVNAAKYQDISSENLGASDGRFRLEHRQRFEQDDEPHRHRNGSRHTKLNV